MKVDSTDDTTPRVGRRSLRSVATMGRETMPYKWVVAVVFVAAFFMDILDTTIVNVALPTLGREFHVGTSSIEWIVVGYLLSLAVWIPASGWIGDRIGTKRTFLFALAVFTTASALCGQAHSLTELVVFRVLQGVGGGMLTPVGTAMLFRAFPPEERARASTVLIIPTVLAPAMGPVLGGYLVTKASWRWIFYVNLPIGIAAFIFGALFLRENKEKTAGPFDAYGFVLSGAGLAMVLYALSEGPTYGWRSARVVVTGLAGTIAFALLVLVELRLEHPMLQLRLLRDRMFRNANLASLFAYASFAGLLFLLPLFLQELRGLSALESGLTTFPQAFGVMISSQLVGRVLYPRLGPRRLMVGGLLGAAAVVYAFTFVDLNTSLWWIRLLMFIRGICMAHAFIPLQAATYATITPSDTGRATAIYSTQRQVAAAFGVAILATLLATLTQSHVHATASSAAQLSGRLAAFHGAFAIAAILAALGAVVALLVRDEDAARTIRPRVTAVAD
jgi:EmrB/QacA subfamily drug resistance transporter